MIDGLLRQARLLSALPPDALSARTYFTVDRHSNIEYVPHFEWSTPVAPFHLVVLVAARSPRPALASGRGTLPASWSPATTSRPSTSLASNTTKGGVPTAPGSDRLLPLPSLPGLSWSRGPLPAVFSVES